MVSGSNRKQGPDFDKKYMIYDAALIWINSALSFANYCMVCI